VLRLIEGHHLAGRPGNDLLDLVRGVSAQPDLDHPVNA
jgi:hypothetical protein